MENIQTKQCILACHRDVLLYATFTVNNSVIIPDIFMNFRNIIFVPNKGKVFYGQEPPSGESTTTECGFNYQLLAVIY